ncbi:MAG: PHP domain-containing protein [Oscillospiraceae bacterium]|jgi:putative hydrolase|nr:PHP domain-containing protein [Oscillospiraceae bacterium]
MRIIADLHCHSIASTHAFSTVDELCAAAARRGLAAVALTDHAPALPDSPHEWHFALMGRLPPLIHGVRLLSGAEFNVTDGLGTLDLPEKLAASLDYTVAAMHADCFPPSAAGAHTEAWLAMARNPLVDCLGHPARAQYPFDIDAVVRACRDTGTLIELNESVLRRKPENAAFARDIMLACRGYGAQIAVASDAHTAYELGDCRRALQMLNDIDFPRELVVNSDIETLREYFLRRKHKDIFPDGGDESVYWD